MLEFAFKFVYSSFQAFDMIHERLEMLLRASLLCSFLSPCTLYGRTSEWSSRRERREGVTSASRPESRQGPQTGSWPSHLLFLREMRGKEVLGANGYLWR